MIPLAERLRVLELQMSPHSMLNADKAALLQDGLDSLAEIASEALTRKNYYALGHIGSLSSKMASRCITLVTSMPDLVLRALKECKVEAEDATDLIIRLHNDGSADKHPELIDALIDNIIGHETFFSIAKPRVSKDLIEDFIRYTPRPGPVIRLCTAVAHSNTKDVAGASFVLTALASVEKLNEQDVEEAKRWPGQTSGYADRSIVISAVNNWLKSAEASIAESIHAGSPGEWTSISSIEIAEAKELPLIAANLLTRLDMLAFPKLSALASSGFFTDRKQMDGVLQTHDANETGQRGSVIAYCLLYKDILPDEIFAGDYPSAFARAAGIMGEEPMHPVHGKAILQRLVDKLTPKDDISPLMKCRFHSELISFRKYRGMTLENELGM